MASYNLTEIPSSIASTSIPTPRSAPNEAMSTTAPYQNTTKSDTIGVENEEIRIPEEGPPSLQNLPLEVRHMIYECLLPGPRLIDLLCRHERISVSFSSLSATCSQILEELELWFKNPRIAGRCIKTSRWGFIDPDPDVTTFLVNIDQGYRNNGHYHPLLQSRIWEVLADRTDADAIHKLVLRFKNPDIPTTSPLLVAGYHSNMMAIQRAWRLQNLQRLDIYIGNWGNGWGNGRESFQKNVELAKRKNVQYCVIPIGCHYIVQLKPERQFPMADESDTGPALPKPVIKIWDYGPTNDVSGGKQLLASYGVK